MSNKEYPLPHPLKNDDIDTLMKKLRMMVRTMEQFHPQETKDKGLMGIHSLVAAMISLAAEVYDSLKKDRVFVACSLTCQMIELEIQLLWLNKHFDTNGSDYMDFGYIEQIDMLRVHPERADRVLNLIKQNNCKRFLLAKPKNSNLLDRANYRKHWYPSTLKSISNECFNDVWEEIKSIPELATYYDHVDVNYENYQLFCGFKHFSTYCVRKCFATSKSFVEDTSEETRWSTLVTNLTTLLSVCQILEQHGDPILHVKPVATEGLTPASAMEKKEGLNNNEKQ
jgi:hypothetical protein